VPNGAPGRPGEGEIVPTEDDAFSYLWNGSQLIPELLGVKKIILSTDGDKPGRILAEELAIRLGRERCWIIEYPDGCKDANDVLIAHGIEGVGDLLTSAKALVPNELVPLTDLVRNPMSVAHSTGWSGADETLMIVPPELIIMTGFPNAGKTEFAWSLGANLSRVHGWKGAIIQFEDGVNRMQDSFINYARHWAGVGPMNTGTSPEAWVRRMIYTPKPEDTEGFEASDRTMRWVMERIKEAGQRHGCRWVIIDPWNEIEHDWGKQYTETQYISRMLKLLKQACRRYTMCIILIAHPKTSSTEKQIADADLNDVSGGMAWNAKADHGIVVARHPIDKSITYVKVCKSRNQQIMGLPGIFQLRFNRPKATYSFVQVGE
jgi:twinkle protein